MAANGLAATSATGESTGLQFATLTRTWRILLVALAHACDEIGMRTTSIIPLLIEARQELGVSQGKLGELLGSSARTGQRWETTGSTPSPEQLHALAALVHPTSSALAAKIAAAGGTTLEKLGLVPSPPSPPPPAPPPPPLPSPDPIHIVDTVVCAAAEAMQVMPDAIRPALRAAFRRARLAGLSVEAVDGALTPAPVPSVADAVADKRAAKK